MNVLSISASISVTITLFEQNLVQISNFTLSTRWNGQIHNLKIQDAGCRHFGFLGYLTFFNLPRPTAATATATTTTTTTTTATA